jgi:hypothetical protein
MESERETSLSHLNGFKPNIVHCIGLFFAVCLLFFEVLNCVSINRNSASEESKAVEFVINESYEGPIGSCVATKAIDSTHRLSLCATYSGYVVDIRQFLKSADNHRQIPTLKGVTLKIEQWQQLISNAEWLQQELMMARGERRTKEPLHI